MKRGLVAGSGEPHHRRDQEIAGYPRHDVLGPGPAKSAGTAAIINPSALGIVLEHHGIAVEAVLGQERIGQVSAPMAA
jgi:hypothetical protein